MRSSAAAAYPWSLEERASISRRSPKPALLAGVPPDAELRRELAALQAREGVEGLAARLSLSDPDRAATIDRANPRRLVRAIEVAEHRGAKGHAPAPMASVIFGIDLPTDALAARIERRVHDMYANGLVEETRALLDRDVPPDAPALTGVGYREAAAAIAGRITLAEAQEQTVSRTRQYARRQRTWFRHQLPVHWRTLKDDCGGAVRAAARHAQRRNILT